MSDGLVARLTRLIAQTQRADRLPSIVLASTQHGNLLLSTALGATAYQPAGDASAQSVATPSGHDAESESVPGADTPYRIGSITKTFTAALVLSLAEDQVLSLDASVSTYIPDTPFGEVPLRTLLAHHSGLPREVPGDMWSLMRGPDDEQLRIVLDEVEPVVGPRTRWHYSNLGYAILGAIVAKQTATSCTQLITEKLLEPLHLSRTSWDRPADAATGYRVDPYADVLYPEPNMDQGAVAVAGQLWSTTSDLLRWGDALLGCAPRVVSPSVVDAMHTPQVMVDPTRWSRGWGLGLILDRRGDRVFAGHTGAMPGFFAALATDRASRTVTVALTNATQATGLTTLALDVTEALATTSTTEPVPWRPAGPIPPELTDVLGRWWSESAETVFTWRADGLHAHLARTPDTDSHFVRTDQDVYRADKGRLQGERLYIHRDNLGRVTNLVWATYPYTRSPR